jgi:hypothetical protein
MVYSIIPPGNDVDGVVFVVYVNVKSVAEVTVNDPLYAESAEPVIVTEFPDTNPCA